MFGIEIDSCECSYTQGVVLEQFNVSFVTPPIVIVYRKVPNLKKNSPNEQIGMSKHC